MTANTVAEIFASRREQHRRTVPLCSVMCQENRPRDTHSLFGNKVMEYPHLYKHGKLIAK